MQTYPVRTDHRRNLEPDALCAIAKNHFENVTADGDSVGATFGALERLEVRSDGRQLSVDVRMNPKVPDPVARDTIAHYNAFLEEVTGYSAKERARRLRKSAPE